MYIPAKTHTYKHAAISWILIPWAHIAAWYWCWKWVQQTRMPARLSEPVIRPSVRIERQLFGRECHGDSENFPCLFYTNTHMFGGYDLVMWCVSFYCRSGIWKYSDSLCDRAPLFQHPSGHLSNPKRSSLTSSNPPHPNSVKKTKKSKTSGLQGLENQSLGLELKKEKQLCCTVCWARSM